MGLTLDALPWLGALIAALIVVIIYIVGTKIPSRAKQREKGERIISKKLMKNYAEVRVEFDEYFRRIFVLLLFVFGSFLAVNVLIALVINIFFMSHPTDPVFTKIPDWSLLRLPPVVVSVGIVTLMCSAGWLMIVSLFYHNRAAKAALETKLDPLFTGEQEL